MQPGEDSALLRQFAESQSDEAFATLVERHINLVYSVALRQVGNPGQAEEITQAVFVILARKALVLRHQQALSSWLFYTTHLTTKNFLRAEIRRRQREQEAYMQSIDNDSDEGIWKQIAPLLDDAVAALGEIDRRAIVMRFYERKTMLEIAAAMGLTEAATKKRIARAVEKLERFFARRGVTSTTAALSEAMSSHSVQSAPLALAKTLAVVAAAKGATASISTLTLIKGALQTMAWTKVKMVATAAAITLLAAGTTTFVLAQYKANDNAVNAKVLAIVQTFAASRDGDFGKAASMIANIGPAALPPLERLIRWKKSYWPFAGVEEHERRRATAVRIVGFLGPVATRQLSSALCDALNDPDFVTFDQATYTGNSEGAAESALLDWSVPDSSDAVKILTRALTDTFHEPGVPGLHVYNTGGKYTRLPNATRLLIPWLRHPGVATYQAADILGDLGPNAKIAIPALIDVAELGIGQPEMLVPSVGRDQKTGLPQTMMVRLIRSDDETANNRAKAMAALGKLGAPQPEVLDMLRRNLHDQNSEVRFAALETLYALHQPTTGEPLIQLLNELEPRRDLEFNEVVRWVGTLGPDGSEALPWLQQLAEGRYADRLPDGIHTNLGYHITVATDDLRATAILSIAEIDPSRINPAQVNATTLLNAVQHDWAAIQRLRQLTNATSIVAVLVPALEITNVNETADALTPSLIAAQIVLGIAPDNRQARSTFQYYATAGSAGDRLCAARWSWEQTGNPTNLVRMAIEGLGSSDYISWQNAAGRLAGLGQAARPAVPVLKKALWSGESIIRERAGELLREIAPEELPSIR